VKRVLLVLLVSLAAATAAPAGGGRAGTAPTVEQMAGQLVLVQLHGATPSASLLARIRAGEVGGVVLYSDDFGAAGPAGLARALQAAASAGGQPPLLVAVDQEGGIVKRLPGAPYSAPPAMRSARSARIQGLATAGNLRAAGINVDLAPVLDVGRGGFITPRTFGRTPAAVAARGPAFAAGLALGHVLATAKHFPGLGYAARNTDATAVTIKATAQKLEADWLPFETAIAAGIPLVMMSTAVYPALGSTAPAALSPTIVGDLRKLGFHGAIVTDALATPAVEKVATTTQAAVEAVAAGDDLVLVPDDPSSYDALVAAAQSGQLPRPTLQQAYRQVLSLKRAL
jgi:beta-N-acetylhexosaminidase